MNKYKLNLTDYEKKKIGFKYVGDLGIEAYSFPVFKHKHKPILYAQIWLDDNNRVYSRVVDLNKKDYPSYTDRTFGNNEVVEIIDNNIEKELKRLGAKKYGSNNRRKRLRKM